VRVDRDGNHEVLFGQRQRLQRRRHHLLAIAPSSQPYTYTFPLPDAPLLGLRLDPFDSGPGEFTITNWRIIERQGKEIRRFTADDLQQLNQIKSVVPVSGGWKLVVGGADPHASLDFPAPIVPEGMNTRNLQRCLLSWGYLALMLWILLLAVYFALVRGGPLRRSLPPPSFWLASPCFLPSSGTDD